MHEFVLEALKLGLWRQLDVRFAYMLLAATTNLHQYNALMLAIITLSAYINQGHVCLPLFILSPSRLFGGEHLFLANEIWKKIGNLSISQWTELLLVNNTIVSNGSYLAPLVLDKGRLYLYRMWNYECSIAKFFYYSSRQLSNISIKENNKIAKLLNNFFPDVTNLNNKLGYRNSNDIDWQKIAVAMTLTSKVTVISGGPGTGKTFIISKLLAIISLLYSNCSLIVKMAAPTGKSVARLNESINIMNQQLSLVNSDFRKTTLSIEVVTLHRLLGMSLYHQNIQRVKYNFLCLDYLIIDESSMIDLSMMAKIIKYLSAKTKIIFLGDYNQLPSVDPGSVFLDLCYFIGKSYTYKFSQRIQNLTNYTLPYSSENEYSITDTLCLLQKNYRFSAISEIGRLANAINSGNQHHVLSLLTSRMTVDICYMVVKDREDYFKMLFKCALGYINYFKNIVSCSCIDLVSILNIFNEYRVLSILREGPFGFIQLNVLIENILRNYGLIHSVDNNDECYVGRPIIVTSNDPSLLLFNGETGIILPDDNNQSDLFAYFMLSNGKINKVPLHKLPKHETNFVMTVHKAQGSEFKYVSLVFPDKITPILTKELFYTGITRARNRLSIYANDKIITHTMQHSYNRYSGLVDRLKHYKEL
ncbi:exodeoxyribonuclease V subunit alpha [Blochmannia endosymbiont of Polyrhachis (Hedomyrma) turneri]|uniref:exodeoxyribonuclease V subunit alpha n=1 Tax=Blochmannia endosymbiont of Polyrhachis (Hedomyrma) turneri TaxID=1505596 RepID=UPI00061A5260|nr:exodeoxyribonuclease V subunit alpha [Blochmannia endosymbiont of Polyrhachis (Hedomyrma) turneri]AKC59869.1 Exodeoxyribonuclease V alpha chain [Blochmannia endosymbiont of Polyrhachis (Hedomyrma) turneri]